MMPSFSSLVLICLAMLLGTCIAVKLNSWQYKPFWRRASLVCWTLLIMAISIRPENCWEDWETIKTLLLESHIIAILTTAALHGLISLYNNTWLMAVPWPKNRKARF